MVNEAKHPACARFRRSRSVLDQYALEHHKQGSDSFAFSDLTPYLKPGSKLAVQGGRDSLGNSLLTAGTTITNGIRVSTASQTTLLDEFWGPYS